GRGPEQSGSHRNDRRVVPQGTASQNPAYSPTPTRPKRTGYIWKNCRFPFVSPPPLSSNQHTCRSMTCQVHLVELVCLVAEINHQRIFPGQPTFLLFFISNELQA